MSPRAEDPHILPPGAYTEPDVLRLKGRSAWRFLSGIESKKERKLEREREKKEGRERERGRRKRAREGRRKAGK